MIISIAPAVGFAGNNDRVFHSQKGQGLVGMSIMLRFRSTKDTFIQFDLKYHLKLWVNLILSLLASYTPFQGTIKYSIRCCLEISMNSTVYIFICVSSSIIPQDAAGHKGYLTLRKNNLQGGWRICMLRHITQSAITRPSLMNDKGKSSDSELNQISHVSHTHSNIY